MSMQILILYILFSKNEFIHFTVFLRISWSALLKSPPGSLGTENVSAEERERGRERERNREREKGNRRAIPLLCSVLSRAKREEDVSEFDVTIFIRSLWNVNEHERYFKVRYCRHPLTWCAFLRHATDKRNRNGKTVFDILYESEMRHENKSWKIKRNFSRHFFFFRVITFILVIMKNLASSTFWHREKGSVRSLSK